MKPKFWDWQNEVEKPEIDERDAQRVQNILETENYNNKLCIGCLDDCYYCIRKYEAERGL